MLDPRHSTEELLDVVFALMGDDPTMFEDVQPSPKPWVLCIDDDYDFSRVLTRRLNSLDIGVINAYDGADGFETAFAQPASVIILDYNMPNGKGDEVLRRLRSTPRTCKIPVIVLTGNKNESVRQTMLNLGAEAFLHKPLEFEVLLAQLRRFIHIPTKADSRGLISLRSENKPHSSPR